MGLLAMSLLLFGLEAVTLENYTPAIEARTKSEVESGVVGDRIYSGSGSLAEQEAL